MLVVGAGTVGAFEAANVGSLKRFCCGAGWLVMRPGWGNAVGGSRL